MKQDKKTKDPIWYCDQNITPDIVYSNFIDIFMKSVSQILKSWLLKRREEGALYTGWPTDHGDDSGDVGIKAMLAK